MYAFPPSHLINLYISSDLHLIFFRCRLVSSRLVSFLPCPACAFANTHTHTYLHKSMHVETSRCVSDKFSTQDASGKKNQYQPLL